MTPVVADYRTRNLLILLVPASEVLPVTAEVASSSLVVPAIHKSFLDFIETDEGAKGCIFAPFSPIFVE